MSHPECRTRRARRRACPPVAGGREANGPPRLVRLSHLHQSHKSVVLRMTIDGCIHLRGQRDTRHIRGHEGVARAHPARYFGTQTVVGLVSLDLIDADREQVGRRDAANSVLTEEAPRRRGSPHLAAQRSSPSRRSGHSARRFVAVWWPPRSREASRAGAPLGTESAIPMTMWQGDCRCTPRP